MLRVNKALHQASVSRVNAAMMLVTKLSLKSMETNSVAPEWGSNPFWSDSIDSNETYVAIVITALTLLGWDYIGTKISLICTPVSGLL